MKGNHGQITCPKCHAAVPVGPNRSPVQVAHSRPTWISVRDFLFVGAGLLFGLGIGIGIGIQVPPESEAPAIPPTVAEPTPQPAAKLNETDVSAFFDFLDDASRDARLGYQKGNRVAENEGKRKLVQKVAALVGHRFTWEFKIERVTEEFVLVNMGLNHRLKDQSVIVLTVQDERGGPLHVPLPDNRNWLLSRAAGDTVTVTGLFKDLRIRRDVPTPVTVSVLNSNSSTVFPAYQIFDVVLKEPRVVMN